MTDQPTQATPPAGNTPPATNTVPATTQEATQQAAAERERQAALVEANDAVWRKLLWTNAIAGKTSEEMTAAMHADPAFATLAPSSQQLMLEAAIVLDASKPQDVRLAAAGRISQDSANNDAGAERFFSKMFTGFTVDGNLSEAERAKIKEVEQAINELVKSGKIKIPGLAEGQDLLQVDGVADNRLAALLRTPEVVSCLPGMQGITFQPNFIASDARLLNINLPPVPEAQQQQSSVPGR